MKVSSHSKVPVYTLAGVGASRELPEWLSAKRKRSLKKDPDFNRRVELLQDFGFEQASSCVRASEDGQWVMSTGTYKPQIRVHNLSELSLSFSRHTNNLNNTFLLLSSDYSKSVHLQADRYIEFHTPMGMHFTTRIPRYGRDLAYLRRQAELIVPASGINDSGNGEVFRLNLEQGRFMRSYEVDVGGDQSASVGYGSLQGSLAVGSVNSVAIAEDSHALMAFGTSIGTVEFWDPRCRAHVAALAPNFGLPDDLSGRPEVTALQFHRDGLNFAVGSSNGITHIYDIRASTPLLQKDHGFGSPIKNIIFLNSDTASVGQDASAKVLTADKSTIKLWDQHSGEPWTSIHPSVDLNHVEWCRNSGMLLTANEGPQQHAFFIPKLGPAPKWCSFLDNIVEEMAEDPNDPNAFSGQIKTGQVFDNFKFVTLPQLQALSLDHLVGTTKLLRPYMHGFFISPKLYDEARLLSNPHLIDEERQKSVQEKIAKERESRIRGKKKIAVKVNRRLVERLLEREEKNERRKAQRVIARGGDDDFVTEQARRKAEEKEEEEEAAVAGSGSDIDEMDVDTKPANESATRKLLTDDRFTSLFKEDDFEVDENSKEFQFFNEGASGHVAKPTAAQLSLLPKALTAAEEEEVEQEERQSRRKAGGLIESSSESEDDSDSDRPDSRKKSKSKSKSNKKKPNKTTLSALPSSGFSLGGSSEASRARKAASTAFMSFESRVARSQRDDERAAASGVAQPKTSRTVMGERELVFVPRSGNKKPKQPRESAGLGADDSGSKQLRRRKDRRSASGNVMRQLR